MLAARGTTSPAMFSSPSPGQGRVMADVPLDPGLRGMDAHLPAVRYPHACTVVSLAWNPLPLVPRSPARDEYGRLIGPPRYGSTELRKLYNASASADRTGAENAVTPAPPRNASGTPISQFTRATIQGKIISGTSVKHHMRCPIVEWKGKSGPQRLLTSVVAGRCASCPPAPPASRSAPDSSPRRSCRTAGRSAFAAGRDR